MAIEEPMHSIKFVYRYDVANHIIVALLWVILLDWPVTDCMSYSVGPTDDLLDRANYLESLSRANSLGYMTCGQRYL